MERRLRNVLLQKENDHKNVNKRDCYDEKIDRLLKIKKINHHEEHKHIKNQKEIKNQYKSSDIKNMKTELKPLTENLSNTQQYCQLYAPQILERCEQNNQSFGSFLISHDIDKGLRARMLDWMVQVTSSYKFTHKTYFTGVQLMDRYFKAEDQRLPITKLHIIGVVSMLIATKMDEVYPLKIKTVYEKIVHKKIEKREIVDMQARIAEKLGFVLNAWTFYDLALLKLHQNWHAKNEEAVKDIEQLCNLIGRFIVFNYELYGHYSINVLAEALLRAACRVYGPEKSRLAMKDRQGFETSRDHHACLELIMDSIRSFKSNHRSLGNIYKFSNETALMRLQQYLKNS